MAKVGILSALNYKLNAQHALLLASSQNVKVQEMARAVPASVYCNWRDTANEEFPGLKTTPVNFAVACSALLQFFHMSAMEKAPMMLPSKAADSVWHTWMAHDQAGLSSFLKTYVGKDIPHMEKNAMPKEGDNHPTVRMADTWRAAHDHDGNTQFAGKLPSIFEADKLTAMPNGFWYDRDPVDRRAGYFHEMDNKGVPNPEPQGQRMLSWDHVSHVMTPERRLKADAEFQPHYLPAHALRTQQAAVMAGLGIVAGTTAAMYLASQEEQMQQAQKQRDIGDSGGSAVAFNDYGGGPGHGSGDSGGSNGGGDGGGGSCGGGGCGGG